mmetsp:Transcript_25133/g.54652  ORF Transcript_25133/g.54652 Transcript_25133/m.54652 type:complete len:146 (+) Transcript_25133:45-482(+)
MSRSYPGEQVEHAFKSHRLCNWQVPKQEVQGTSASSRWGTLKIRTGKTDFIVDQKGYVQEGAGTTKLQASFDHHPEVYMKSIPRWPQPNPTIPAYSSATMGYKGIPTTYLPGSTVALSAVDAPHKTQLDSRVQPKYSKEYNYNFM